MAEEKESVVKTTITGWIKGISTSILGLLSGAALMYLTPLVNNVVKPAKPISNFAAQVNGTNVNFNNRSTGGIEGWWDFGDGTALEPFDPKVENVPHTYKKPGTYNVKLSLQNLIGEAADRTAPVTIDSDAPPTQMDLSSFELKALTPSETAPAVYQLQAKIAGATHCILCRGDSKPMKIIDDPGRINEVITFEEMGAFTIRLAAVNGKQLIEKSQDVFIGANEGGDLLAKLKVTYEAVRVERQVKTWRIPCAWHGDLNESFCAFCKERPADPGSLISAVELVNKNDPNAPRKVDCKPSDDRKKVVLTGELVRPTGLTVQPQTAPKWLAEVKTTMERRSPPRTVTRDDVTMAVAPGRSVKIPLQALGNGWEPVRTQVSVELWDGNRKIWSGEPPIANAAMTWKNQSCKLSAVQQSDGVVVSIVGSGVQATPVVLPKKSLDVLPPPSTTVVPPLDVLPPLPGPKTKVQPSVIAPPPPTAPVGPAIRKVGYDYDPRRPFGNR